MPTKKRKNYTEEAMNHYFDGSYYAHPSNISTPDSVTNDIWNMENVVAEPVGYNVEDCGEHTKNPVHDNLLVL